jgi:hypothetical protein
MTPLQPPSREQLLRAHAIVEHVRIGPFDLANQVYRLTKIAELAVAIILAQRDQETLP